MTDGKVFDSNVDAPPGAKPSAVTDVLQQPQDDDKEIREIPERDEITWKVLLKPFWMT